MRFPEEYLQNSSFSTVGLHAGRGCIPPVKERALGKENWFQNDTHALLVYNKEPLTSGAGGGVTVTWDQRLLPPNPEVALHSLTSQKTKQVGRPLRKLLQWAEERSCLGASVGMHRVNVSFRAMLGKWRPMQ